MTQACALPGAFLSAFLLLSSEWCSRFLCSLWVWGSQRSVLALLGVAACALYCLAPYHSSSCMCRPICSNIRGTVMLRTEQRALNDAAWSGLLAFNFSEVQRHDVHANAMKKTKELAQYYSFIYSYPSLKGQHPHFEGGLQESHWWFVKI